MSFIFSRESRIIWRRRIQGFWEEFSRKKIGIAGLLLLLFFVFMAIFAPWLTPYDPIANERVADNFAMPQWVRVFPQYQKLPLTRRTSLDWSVKTPSPYVISWGRNVSLAYQPKRAESVDIQFNSSITYTDEIPPNTFFFDFTWSINKDQDVDYSIKFFAVNTMNRSQTFLLYVNNDNVAKGENTHIDSVDPILMYRLGLSPGVDILGNVVFPSKGDYEFILDLYLKAQSPSAALNFNFGDASFVTLGRVHGILGTDNAGADIFSQIVWGARISLMIGIIAAVISTVIGLAVGVATGYLGGIVDEAMMRIVDILLCLPILPLLLTLVFLFGKNVFYIILFVAIFGWQGLSRIVRSQVLSLRESSFIECARASGGSKSYIMIKHLVPNVLPVAFASLILSVPAAILFEASLSFLGFGDPRAATWGKILHQGFGFGGFSHLAWWWILPPGVCITGLCLSFVFMGHAIDEVVNPRLRRRR
jgi:peptide/nickel transport system permease protein